MGRVHFIGGEKGGVGKSFTARLLAQYFIDTGTPFIGFDSDQSHSTFSRFYSEFTSYLEVNNDASLDAIIEASVDNPNHDIIVDLAAQTFRRLGQWIEESGIFSIFSELNHQIYFWHVMDDGADSKFLLDITLDRYTQPEVHFVIVQNLGRGENFDLFEQSATRKKAQLRSAHFLTLNRLQTELTRKIDFNNFSFWAAANSRDQMSITERQRMRVWLKNCYEKLDGILAVEQTEARGGIVSSAATS
jgi:hypothetical protein